jgi:hypothetical protein
MQRSVCKATFKHAYLDVATPKLEDPRIRGQRTQHITNSLPMSLTRFASYTSMDDP